MLQAQKNDVRTTGFLLAVVLSQLFQFHSACWTTYHNVTCCNCSGHSGRLHCVDSCPPAFFRVLNASSECMEGNGSSTASALQNISAVDPGIPRVVCEQCHHACSDCEGPGSHNCSKCAEGYKKSYKMASSNKTCVKILSAQEHANRKIHSLILVLVSLFALGVVLALVAIIIIGVLRRRRKRRAKQSTPDSLQMAHLVEGSCSTRSTVSTISFTENDTHCAESDRHMGGKDKSYETSASPVREKVRKVQSFSGSTKHGGQKGSLAFSDAVFGPKKRSLSNCRRKRTSSHPQEMAALPAEAGDTFLRVTNVSDRSFASCEPKRLKRRHGDDIEERSKTEEDATVSSVSSQEDTILQRKPPVVNKNVSSCSGDTVATQGGEPSQPSPCKPQAQRGGKPGVRALKHKGTPLPGRRKAPAGQARQRGLQEEDQASSGYASDDSRRTVRSLESCVHRLSLPPSDTPLPYGSEDSLCSRPSSRKSTSSLAALHKPETKTWVENISPTNTMSIHTQTETSTEGDCLQPPLMSKKWQFSNEFRSQGGILQGQHSDVMLKVPAGAVHCETIHGAVFVDLQTVHSLCHLPESERVASPVVEYHATKNCRFRQPLEICLPHFLPTDSSQEEVRVYEFSADQYGGVRLQALKPLQKNNLLQDEAQESEEAASVFCLGKDNLLHIFVRHFTGYFCVFDCKKTFSPPIVNLRLYASHTEVRGKRKVTIRLDVWDSRLNIKDFTEAGGAESLEDRQLELVVRRCLQRLRCEQMDMDSVVIRATLEMSQEDELCWAHCRDRQGALKEPAEKIVDLHTLVPCQCQNPAPEVLQWLLENQPDGMPPDIFECSVYCGYVRTEDKEFLSSPARVCMDVRARKFLDPAEQPDNNDLISSNFQLPNNQVSVGETETKTVGGSPAASSPTLPEAEKLARAEGGVSLPSKCDNSREASVVNHFYGAKYVSLTAQSHPADSPHIAEDEVVTVVGNGPSSPLREARDESRPIAVTETGQPLCCERQDDPPPVSPAMTSQSMSSMSPGSDRPSTRETEV